MYLTESRAVRFADAVDVKYREVELELWGIGLEVIVRSEVADQLDIKSQDIWLPEEQIDDINIQVDRLITQLHTKGDMVIVVVCGRHSGFDRMSDFLASLAPLVSSDAFEGDPVDQDASHGPSPYGLMSLIKVFTFSHPPPDTE